MSGLIIAVDPGVGRTGVLIMNRSHEVLAGATFTSGQTEFVHGMRVMELAGVIGEWLFDNTPQEYWGTQNVLAIETPVMNKVRNVKTYALQWRLVQAIIDGTRDAWDTCVEVHNATAKKAATCNGDADKPQIVAVSPFSYGMFGTTKTGDESVEALADAWAIGKAATMSLDANASYVQGREVTACNKQPVHEV